MLKKVFWMLAFAGVLVSCSNQTDTAEESEATETESTTEAAAEESKHFGETITAEDAMSYAELYQKMGEADSIPAKVTATVEAVCQVKGCWMDIAAESETGEPMRVRFKDYGFFVPKDIGGRKVVMEGYAYREVTSVDELRHYAEDEGLPQEEIDKITEPREELKFLASGVLLLEEEGK
jgi:hypothetical protein